MTDKSIRVGSALSIAKYIETDSNRDGKKRIGAENRRGAAYSI